MKQVFSLLLAFVFLQAETWAIGGGPEGGGSGSSLVGTYAGVLIPTSETNPPAAGTESSASIGLFGIGVPDTGVATGAAVAFVNGIAFIGTVTGIADPDAQTLNAIVEATSDNQVTTLLPVVDANGNITYQQVKQNIFAQGSIKADFENGGGSVDPTSGAIGATARLGGTASLDLYLNTNANGSPDIFNTVKFKVDGFQQSSTSSTVTISLTSTTGA